MYGAAPPKGVIPAELITVLVKLAPGWFVLLIKASRLNILPFGAFNAITRSLTHAWVTLNLALTPVIVAPAGIPATVILEVVAGYDVGTGGIAGPSGIVIFTGPEAKLFEND